MQKGRKKILPHFEVKSENRNFDSIALTPIVLQKKLEKKCDLRVVMTAKRVFAFSITNKRGQAVEDWRVSSMEKLKIKKINIPNGVQLKLKKLLKARDLQMGCADFVLTDKNEWQFLELNRPGAWLFLQKLSRVSIADFLVKEMCR